MQNALLLTGVSAVDVGGAALLIEGPPGSGKSSLALGLIDRGAKLIGDDGVTLERHSDGPLMASPPPNIAGKLEIRGVGLVDLPTCSAPVALLLALGEAVERLPGALMSREWLGHPIPVLPFSVQAPDAALRAEWALKMHGSPASGSGR